MGIKLSQLKPELEACDDVPPPEDVDGAVDNVGEDVGEDVGEVAGVVVDVVGAVDEAEGATEEAAYTDKLATVNSINTNDIAPNNLHDFFIFDFS